MHSDIDIIVKKVLYHMGEIKKAVLLSPFEYSQHSVQILESDYMPEVLTLEEAENAVLKDRHNTLIFIPSLTSQEMMGIAAGTGGSPLMDVVIHLLLRNIKVHVLEGGELEQLLHQQVTPFIAKHLEAYGLLKASGLVIGQICPTQGRTDKTYEEQGLEGVQRTHPNSLLHEGHVITYENDKVSQLTIKKGTIITPLAQDKLRKSTVSIMRESGRK